jgi:hypothetical protein
MHHSQACALTQKLRKSILIHRQIGSLKLFLIKGLISLILVSQSSNGYVISTQGNRVVKIDHMGFNPFLPCIVNGELVVALQRKCSPTTFLAVYIDLLCRIMLKSSTL